MYALDFLRMEELRLQLKIYEVGMKKDEFPNQTEDNSMASHLRGLYDKRLQSVRESLGKLEMSYATKEKQ